MTPTHTILTGDCREVMAGLDAESVDAIVTDPPYGLSFMGIEWDKGVPGEPFWAEALRVAKPGAHLLAFGGTRMVHRLAVAIEDAGWEIRDRIHWVYGSGFPNSHDVSKAIDKLNGRYGKRGEMKRGGDRLASLGDGKRDGGGRCGNESGRNPYTTIAESDDAKRWRGWGTALKPAVEPIILARKPLIGTVAANVHENGTGGLNIDGCRVGNERAGWKGGAGGQNQTYSGGWQKGKPRPLFGRWPANLIHDGSEEATVGMSDASRYFYCPKSSKADRDDGLEGEPVPGVGCYGDRRGKSRPSNKNHHPTVKPTDLMAYLCRLITPPGGTVLDPFAGSGSTGKAAIREGFGFIGIEKDPEYAQIARAMVAAEASKSPLFMAHGP